MKIKVGNLQLWRRKLHVCLNLEYLTIPISTHMHAYLFYNWTAPIHFLSFLNLFNDAYLFMTIIVTSLSLDWNASTKYFNSKKISNDQRRHLYQFKYLENTPHISYMMRATPFRGHKNTGILPAMLNV